MSYTSLHTSIRKFVRDIVPKCYLPAIQRELVWDTEKIENYFDSIARGYPFGTLLLWNVRRPAIHNYSFYEIIREYDAEHPHNRKANLYDQSECFGILDGQQRTTALLLGLKGSFRVKKPRKWKTSPDAWVKKQLYINLLHTPPEGGEEKRYEFEFLSEDEAKRNGDNQYWFQVGEILKFESEQALRDWRRQTPFRDNNVFEDTLNTLWNAIERESGIPYFLEDNQDLNDVLTIFVRLNMGGEPLSYSDLLLSLATASWKSYDAREEVYNLVEFLNNRNECGAPFAFNKDFVLKTLLVFNDRDIRFRTENIQHDANLESKWENVKNILPLAVRLAASFGFNEQNLTARYSLIPITYYLNRTGRDQSFLTSGQYSVERDRIRHWLLIVLLGRVFGRQTDNVLSKIRNILKPLSIGDSFPAEKIFHELKLGQELGFSREAAEAWVNEAIYGTPMAFQILSIISPRQIEPGIQYNLDHIHPKANFSADKMKSIGMPDADIPWALERRDLLPNLQLLPGPVNSAKLAMPYDEWLSKQPQPELYRNVGMTPEDINLKFASFREFYEARYKLLVKKLLAALGVENSPNMEKGKG